MIHRSLAIVAFVLIGVSATGQQFERYESNPEHKQRDWYQYFLKGSPNYYVLQNLLHADSTVDRARPSEEARKVLRWIAENRAYANQVGEVTSKWSSADDIGQFLKLSFERKQADATLAPKPAWEPIGPFGWDTTATMATGSQGIGVLRTLITDPSNSSVILAGGISSGIWRSVDAGKTWKNIAVETPIQTVWRFAYSSSSAFAATNDGLYVSIDRGVSWRKVTLSGDALLTTARSVDLVAVSPKDHNRVVIAAMGRLYTSTDGGLSWRQSCNFEGTWWDLLWHPTSNEVCYGLVQQGAHIAFIRSTSGGAKFDAVGRGYPEPAADTKMARGAIAVSSAAPNMVAIALGGSRGDTASGTYGIYVSTDQGSTFEHRCCGAVDGPEVADKTSNPNFFDYDVNGNGLGQITWDMAFAISSANPNKMVIAGIFPYITSDGGKSWSTLPATHYDVQSCTIRGDSIWITTDGGVVLSPDGGKTLQERSFGIAAQEIWGFDQSHDGSVMTIGAYHLPTSIRDTIVYSPAKPIDGWYAWSGADAMGANVNPIASEWLYVKPWSSVRGQRAMSKTVPPASVDLGIDLGYITMDNITADPLRFYKLYAIDYKTQRVVTSSDNASSWTTVKQFVNWAFRLRVCPTNSQYQMVLGDNALWYSSDAGTTWKNITPPTNISRGRGIADMAFEYTKPNTLYAVFNGTQQQAKAAISVDGGLTWSDISRGLPEAAVRTIVSRQGVAGELYCGTNAGVYRYSPETSWELFGTGLPLCEAHTLHINDKHGVMRVATSRGLWQVDLPATTSPRAQISFDTDTVRCSRIPVRYGCRSAALETTSFSRYWQFEGGQPATSADPSVLVYYARPGRYAVKLIVTNEYGSDTMTIDDAIVVMPSECDGIDPTPGFAADLTNADDHVTLGRFSTTVREFTFSAWVKPQGLQPGFAAILCTDADQGVSQEIGLQFVNDRNELGYLWTGGQWWWNSGLRVEPDVWSHVALTIDSNGATVYVNGYPSSNAVRLSPLQLQSLVFKLGTYHYWSSRNYSGFIDEVSLYTRKLSQDEIRRLMHLTRLSNETGLLAYYQFNESSGQRLYEKITGMDGALEAGARRAPSEALVGPGASQVVQLTSSSDTVFFDRHSARIDFTQPLQINTSLALTRLYVLPDSAHRPTKTLLGSWFILDAFTLDKRSLEMRAFSVVADSLFDPATASGRRFNLQSRQRWDVQSAFSSALTPSGLTYNASRHLLSANTIERGMLTPQQLCISYDGTTISVQDDSAYHATSHIRVDGEHIIIAHSNAGHMPVLVFNMVGEILASAVTQLGTQTVVYLGPVARGVYFVSVNGKLHRLTVIP